MNKPNDIIIIQTDFHYPQYQQVWDLREAVLRKPLGLSLKNDNLSRDYIDTIFVAEHNDRVIGCVFMHYIDEQQLQLRAMAVYDEWQGKGVGRLLVQAAEQFAREKNFDKILLHAREVALNFYSGMGYSITSDKFTEVGIPHFMMEKRL
jgi:N-acetylglutamate synthase-like GNAT family acetyltransferase